VLHQLGNHGPAYFQRYPQAFRRFTPTCDTTELGNCTQQALINTYDNGVLYTDHFLAQTIAMLKAQEKTHNTALVYMSDHGESLGENGLYLHSLPYAIAPDVQTHVPMVMWLSDGYVAAEKIDTACLRRVAGEPASHDNLFHTVLGLTGVHTRVYDAARDLTRGCRGA
jgi:lipid A ethanolaminephosphotransferase